MLNIFKLKNRFPMPRQTFFVPYQGQARRVTLVSPPTPAAGVPNVIIGLHGGGSNGDQFERQSRLSVAAAEKGWYVAYPDGSGFGFMNTWNAGHCCGYAQMANVDDVGYLGALTTHLAQMIGNQPDFWLAGFSNGAMMAYRAGIELGNDVISGIAVVSGSTWFDPNQVMPLIAIHGEDDQNVPIAGGIGNMALQPVSHRSFADTTQLFIDQVNPHTVDEQTVGLATIKQYKDTGPVYVQTVRINDLEHQWPYANTYDAAREIIKFFAQT